jgi:hypothetical protein
MVGGPISNHRSVCTNFRFVRYNSVLGKYNISGVYQLQFADCPQKSTEDRQSNTLN